MERPEIAVRISVQRAKSKLMKAAINLTQLRITAACHSHIHIARTFETGSSFSNLRSRSEAILKRIELKFYIYETYCGASRNELLNVKHCANHSVHCLRHRYQRRNLSSFSNCAPPREQHERKRMCKPRRRLDGAMQPQYFLNVSTFWRIVALAFSVGMLGSFC